MKRPDRSVSPPILKRTSIFCLFFIQSAFAAPDPRDSVIIESKTVEPVVGKPATRVRVYITNKDSLAGFSLALVERSISGGAYLTLAWPRTFDSVVTSLTSTLQGFKALNAQRYDGVSPDTLLMGGIYNGSPETAEPPNLTRKPFWEIRFDTIRSSAGSIELDSALIVYGSGYNLHANRTDFVDKYANTVSPNFVKGIVIVEIPAPCIAKRLDLKEDGALDLSDVVLLINCAFSGKGDCKEIFTAADVVILLNFIFLGNAPPPPPTC